MRKAMPIQMPSRGVKPDVQSIPWGMIAGDHAESRCQANHGQSLEQIAERAGFGADEALRVMSGMSLRDDLDSEEAHHRLLYAIVVAYNRGIRKGASIAAESDDIDAALTQYFETQR